MEIKSTKLNAMKGVHFCLCAFLLCALMQLNSNAQEPPPPPQPSKFYTIKNGKMLIALSKKLSEASLDSFISKYSLGDLALKHFIKTNSPDSLERQGWKIEMNNSAGFTISKALAAAEDINKIVEKYNLMTSYSQMFPAVSNRITYGYNKFRNKYPFAVKDSIVTFFLRNNLRATKVMLAGSFNNWDPGILAMKKTDSGWITNVRLGPGKYWYKFVADENWMVDSDNLLRENDGRGNINSVFYRTNTVFTLNSFNNARKVFLSGSFNNWRPSDLQMNKTATGWELPLYLGQGTHTYKFVADGHWLADEKNNERLPDGLGNYNSVVKFGKPYLFKLRGYENAKHVVLVGSFNNWREFELVMNKTANGWQLPYVIGPGNYEYKFIVDGKWIKDPDNQLTSNNAENSGNSFLVIEPNYTFRLKNFANARDVFLAGDFNSWNPSSLRMRKEGNDWVFQVHLSPGKHRYKFVVDGEWILDPGNKLWEQNEHRTGNSIIWIE